MNFLKIKWIGILSFTVILFVSGCTTTRFVKNAGDLAAYESGISIREDLIVQNGYGHKEDVIPMKTPAVVDKFWLCNQRIDEKTFMQGTWVYFELYPSRWAMDNFVNEADYVEKTVPFKEVIVSKDNKTKQEPYKEVKSR